MPNDRLFEILIRIIVVITALPVHEFAHAFVAYKLGDNTAKYQGRLTLNPLSHLDPIGSITTILFGFGWAKAVPVNPYMFKNRKLGMALVSLAGPLSNVLMATAYMLIIKILSVFGILLPGAPFFQVLIIMISVNLNLAVFNLLPIPPLDGSRIATLFLDERTYFKIMHYERYIFIALIALMATPIFDGVMGFFTDILWNAINFITSIVYVIAGVF